MIRTIVDLRGAGFVRAPFLWSARHFLTLTHAVSRRQECIADQVAARVAGVNAIASALRRISVAAALYAVYLNQEVNPALNGGLIPPIAAGLTDSWLPIGWPSRRGRFSKRHNGGTDERLRHASRSGRSARGARRDGLA